MENQRLLLISTSITLVIVRAWETIMVVFFENSSLWQTVKNDNLEHYQLGFLLFIISFIFSNMLSNKSRIVICGVGIGLIIDEIHYLLSVVFRFPYTFNSSQEWFSVLIIYFVFLITF